MTKDYISPKGEKALIQVAEWLEAGAPHVDVNGRKIDDFDMEYSIHNDSCGTSCCIAGSVCQFNGLGVLDDDGGMEFWSDTSDDVLSLSTDYLGISKENADLLFLPWNWFECQNESDFSNPTVAAKVVRHFVDTGVVDWEKFM